MQSRFEQGPTRSRPGLLSNLTLTAALIALGGCRTPVRETLITTYDADLHDAVQQSRKEIRKQGIHYVGVGQGELVSPGEPFELGIPQGCFGLIILDEKKGQVLIQVIHSRSLPEYEKETSLKKMSYWQPRIMVIVHPGEPSAWTIEKTQKLIATLGIITAQAPEVWCPGSGYTVPFLTMAYRAFQKGPEFFSVERRDSVSSFFSREGTAVFLLDEGRKPLSFISPSPKPPSSLSTPQSTGSPTLSYPPAK